MVSALTSLDHLLALSRSPTERSRGRIANISEVMPFEASPIPHRRSDKIVSPGLTSIDGRELPPVNTRANSRQFLSSTVRTTLRHCLPVY